MIKINYFNKMIHLNEMETKSTKLLHSKFFLLSKNGLY